MGVSEEALAQALGGRRNDVVIATKFGVGYEEMPNRRDSSRARVLASIEKSLRRLRTDHVDIYLVHWPDPNTPLEETMGALDDILRQGIRRLPHDRGSDRGPGYSRLGDQERRYGRDRRYSCPSRGGDRPAGLARRLGQ